VPRARITVPPRRRLSGFIAWCLPGHGPPAARSSSESASASPRSTGDFDSRTAVHAA